MQGPTKKETCSIQRYFDIEEGLDKRKRFMQKEESLVPCLPLKLLRHGVSSRIPTAVPKISRSRSYLRAVLRWS